MKAYVDAMTYSLADSPVAVDETAAATTNQGQPNATNKREVDRLSEELEVGHKKHLTLRSLFSDQARQSINMSKQSEGNDDGDYGQ